MGYARIEISPQLIAEALHMPAGARIIDACWNSYNQTIEMEVSDPQLPEHSVFEKTPRYDPTCTKQDSVVWNWGEPRGH